MSPAAKRIHRVLAVFAHPDDESYGPGATLARLSSEGSEVHLLTLTRGESASMGDSSLFSPERLAQVREKELDCACRALGIADHKIMDFPDGGLAEVPRAELAAPVIRALERLRPQLVVTFHPDGISGHPDHRAASRAVSEAVNVLGESGPDASKDPKGGQAGDRPSKPSPGDGVSAGASSQTAGLSADGESAKTRLAYYVVPDSVGSKINWRRLFTVPDEQVTHAVEMGGYREAKVRAVHCHKTQRYLYEKLSEFPGGIQALWRYEYFIVEGQRRQGAPGADLMARAGP